FAIIAGLFVIGFLIFYLRCPYKFPYKEISFDISSKRQPDILDYIDQYLINNGKNEIVNAITVLGKWKKDCEQKIAKATFKKHRQKQYLNCLDENHLFKFVFYRIKTRYRQVNYVRYPYQVKEINHTYSTNYTFLNDRFLQLQAIGFECTLKEYNSSNQRKLMTKDLRNQVAIRDNFTCQQCGKYMPDGVGLHIDHIIPISKGGKSIASNLQVLCSKCNGSKSNK
ncbi:MAG: HNH endonuclease, partial [Clostridia bacterium]|nr:HNH endonuclease [Clostridia bacterium]